MLTTLFLATATATAAAAADTTPIDCGNCAAWNEMQAPFRLHGDSWYVGTKGLSAILVATPDGLILIDGGLPQSAPLIASNIETLGYAVTDVRWILNSHAHFDHAGGIAALQRLSGAQVAATALGAEALRLGNASSDDPQAGFGKQANAYPAVADVKVLADGATLQLGGTTLTLHASPGHTPGGSTWTWRSCAGDDCRDLVYADSLTAVSSPDYRFSDHPEVVAQFRATFAMVAGLPCDLLVSSHPSASGLPERLAARLADPSRNALIDAQACRNYSERAAAGFDKRLSDEAAGSP